MDVTESSLTAASGGGWGGGGGGREVRESSLTLNTGSGVREFCSTLDTIGVSELSSTQTTVGDGRETVLKAGHWSRHRHIES